jgi:membrane-bound metal-dependent hydrolase YbcI (DUF457 family)
VLGRTHALTGVAAGLGFVAMAGQLEQTPIAAYGVAAFSALVPDLDQHKAMAARYAPAKIAHPLLRHFRHRQFTHSLLGTAVFALVVLLIVAALDRFEVFVAPGVIGAAIAGYVSHLFADAFNKQGIGLFYPFSRGRLEWIAVPLPRSLRISTIYDPQGLPLTLGRIQARIPTERVFFRWPVYAVIAYLAWHGLDGLVIALRADVWGAVEVLPEPLSGLLRGLLARPDAT